METPYQRYYKKNKDALLAKQREAYNPDNKKAYYEANKTAIIEKNKIGYVGRKNNEKKALIDARILTADETLRATLNELLKDEKYKDMKPSAVKAICSINT
jgi:predicted component of type VI protein secretion system